MKRENLNGMKVAMAAAARNNNQLFNGVGCRRVRVKWRRNSMKKTVMAKAWRGANV